jgi:cytochrome c oxidase subunit 3
MSRRVEHQFDDAFQQHESAYQGMWIFLATEVLFFGAVLFGYTVYRSLYYRPFLEGSHHLSVMLGGINTAVLLCSSLCMALAVHAAQRGHSRQLIVYLLVTALIGTVFLGIKFVEYYEHYKEHMVPGLSFSYSGDQASHVELFMIFYFILTGMHAVHMLIGLGMLLVLAFLASRRKFSAEYYGPIDIGGLYWHFVDIVWVFLFPLLYLVDKSAK